MLGHLGTGLSVIKHGGLAIALPQYAALDTGREIGPTGVGIAHGRGDIGCSGSLFRFAQEYERSIGREQAGCGVACWRDMVVALAERLATEFDMARQHQPLTVTGLHLGIGTQLVGSQARTRCNFNQTSPQRLTGAQCFSFLRAIHGLSGHAAGQHVSPQSAAVSRVHHRLCGMGSRDTAQQTVTQRLHANQLILGLRPCLGKRFAQQRLKLTVDRIGCGSDGQWCVGLVIAHGSAFLMADNVWSPSSSRSVKRARRICDFTVPRGSKVWVAISSWLKP